MQIVPLRLQLQPAHPQLSEAVVVGGVGEGAVLLVLHRRHQLARVVVLAALQALHAQLVHLVVALVAVDGAAAFVRARVELARLGRLALRAANVAEELVVAFEEVHQLLHPGGVFHLLRLQPVVAQVDEVRVEEGFPLVPYLRVQEPYPRPLLLRVEVGHEVPPQAQDVRLQEAHQVDEHVQDRADHVHAVVGRHRVRCAQAGVQLERRIDGQPFDRVLDLVEQFAHDAVLRV